MITAYSFGRLEIDGTEFKKDLIIHPDGSIHHPWWRKSGHRLTLEDLEPVLDSAPDILVVGTGAYGIMKLESGLTSKLEELAISVKVMDTKRAVKEYNDLLTGGRNVATCLHLTC